MSMNKMIAMSMLVLSACAAVSGAGRNSIESAAGRWRGTLAKGEARSEAEFRFSQSGSGWEGSFWGRSLTPIALKNVQLGRSVHFEIPEMGVFDGTSTGETMEGEFRDESGEGTFKLEKERDWDHPFNAP